ncbi:hypothetical protein MYAM1_000004 [Malassezia yamatoensis]|uniref:Uncharacterized protein n=1 Tax=Malassezia yamatoensis TaxID=253288 RepID=A0AAJ5YQG5_9BASI|nr:hypothetical protein MYAM1_000004 [Malassezia yamatoensis]
MSSFRFFTFLALALVATVLASPVSKDSVSCKPIGHPTKLVNYNPEFRTSSFFKTANSAKHPRLLAANSSSEKFQFYHCSLPSDKYSKEKNGIMYGQLRSVKLPGLCMTPNNVNVEGPSTNDGWINTETVPPNTDGTITFRKCATTDTEVMRRQWLALQDYGSKKPCSFPSIFQKGRKGDLEMLGLTGDSNSSSFYFPFKESTSTAYLADALPASCKGKL